MKVLYCVPIMHTPEELGSLAKPVLEIERKLHGPQAEKFLREKANQHWLRFTKRLKKEELNTIEKCKKMHIYVGGLPQAEDQHLQKLVGELIEVKLPTYQIIKELLEKGATIHGTESWKLLLEEHKMWQKAAEGISADPKRKAELLRERDRFIAKRIDETLPENGIGILFIGAAHGVGEELDKLLSKIKVIYL